MATTTLMLFGAISLERLPIELLPDISYPTLTVRSQYPDAAPEEVERAVAEPIEEAVSTVEGVRRVRSASRAEVAEVVVELAWGTDVDEVSQRLRERLDLLNFDEGVERPQLLRYDPAFDPVLRLGFRLSKTDASGPPSQRQLAALRRVLDTQIIPAVQRAVGVAMVRAEGGPEAIIHVEARPDACANAGVAPSDIAAALRAANVNIPAGVVREGRQELRVRTLNALEERGAIEEVLVPLPRGGAAPVRELAHVRTDWKEPEVLAWLDGEPSVQLAVYREAGANIVSTATGARQAAASATEAFARAVDGATIELAVLSDASTFVRASIDEVRDAALLGGLLAVLVLVAFVHRIYPTLAVALSIPTSVLLTFIPMMLAGITLNLLSLGGLALGVGMLVDNAIVVVESAAQMRARGMSALEAAVKGASAVSGAVVASTLTTIAVFGPLVFVDGVAGQIFGDFAATVVFSLTASLITALFVVPAFIAHEPSMAATRPRSSWGVSAWREVWRKHQSTGLLAEQRWPRALRGLRWVGLPWVVAVALLVFVLEALARPLLGAFAWIRFGVTGLLRGLALPFHRGLSMALSPMGAAAQRAHRALLRSALRHPLLMGLAVASAVVAAGAGWRSLGVELLAEPVQPTLLCDIVPPAGTSLALLAERALAVDELARDLPGVQSRALVVRSATAQLEALGASTPEATAGGVLELRFASAALAVDAQRALATQAARIPGLDVRVRRPALVSLEAPLEVIVTGHDLPALRTTADAIVGVLRSHPAVTSVRSASSGGAPELRLVLRRDQLARFGLDPERAAQGVRSALAGDRAIALRDGEETLDVVTRSALRPTTPEELGGLAVGSFRGAPITLDAVATQAPGTGPGEIRHVEGRRAAVVRAELAPGAELGATLAELDTALAAVPAFPQQDIQLQGQREELQRARASLLFALGLAIFLVFAVMAIQFESLVVPLVILFTVPLGAVGAVAALWWSELPLSILAYLGLIVMAGIVVNNAIVLLDAVQQNEASGMERTQALELGAAQRLRPIAMTTATTLLGLLPMVFGSGEGSELRTPLAVVLMGGLAVSTLLCLVVIPVIYRYVPVASIRPASPSPRTGE